VVTVGSPAFNDARVAKTSWPLTMSKDLYFSCFSIASKKPWRRFNVQTYPAPKDILFKTNEGPRAIKSRRHLATSENDNVSTVCPKFSSPVFSVVICVDKPPR